MRASSAGSSPRVRGTLTRGIGDACGERFIPACAGNARLHRGPVTKRPVHPRVCGERHFGSGRSFRLPGSSPRVRGTRVAPRFRQYVRRFIPACAGNALAMAIAAAGLAVHPRVCGERVTNTRATIDGGGSSPRVRGTRAHCHIERKLGRFIPACAGNAGTFISGLRGESVHPRVCGERPNRRRHAASAIGSSPRVRGTRLRRRPRARAVRFIPACAGNATAVRRTVCRCAVHPRVCGERWTPDQAFDALSGSSPRVRGTRQSVAQDLLPTRFIPACAGNA